MTLLRPLRVRAQDNLNFTDLHPRRPQSVHGLCIFSPPVQAGYAGPPASHQYSHAGLAGYLAGTACNCGVRPCIAVTPSPAHQAGKLLWRQHWCSLKLQQCCSLADHADCGVGHNPRDTLPHASPAPSMRALWFVGVSPEGRRLEWYSAATGCSALYRGTLLQSRTKRPGPCSEHVCL